MCLSICGWQGFTYYDTVEKESMDRRSIALSGMQLDLVQAIASQTTTPIIVVLIHGGAQQQCFLVGSEASHFTSCV